MGVPIEARPYQKTALEAIEAGKNVAVVYPTGTGKGMIGFLAADYALSKGKVLILAPTRALVDQHFAQCLGFFPEIKGKIVKLTGEEKPLHRPALWQEGKLFVATPQTVHRDLLRRRGNLKGFSLVVFDEFHHCRGRDSYVYLARGAKNSGIQRLSLSAFVEDKAFTLEELGLDQWIQLDETSKELAGFLFSSRKEIINVRLDDSLKDLLELADQGITAMVFDLAELGVVWEKSYLGYEEMEENIRRWIAQAQASFSSEEKDALWQRVRLGWAYLTLQPAYRYLVCENLSYFLHYFKTQHQKARKDKVSSALIFTYPEVMKAEEQVTQLLEEGYQHPKVKALLELCRREVELGHKIIVFAQYRESNRYLAKLLSQLEMTAVSLMGKKEQSGKKQREAVEKFAKGEAQILVATSAGQEGLHFPEADTVIHFSLPVSVTELVQRNGRVGRVKPGSIFYLVMDYPLERALFYPVLAGYKKTLAQPKPKPPKTPRRQKVLALERAGQERLPIFQI